MWRHTSRLQNYKKICFGGSSLSLRLARVSRNSCKFASLKLMNKRLIFATAAEVLRVPDDSVAFVVADGNYSSITLADGNSFVVTLQLGQIERRIAEMLDHDDNRFIRIGKSLIVNRDFIAYINPSRQKMVLSDCRTFRHELSASKEALKALKELLEKEVPRCR